jgi:hypothetical protein
MMTKKKLELDKAEILNRLDALFDREPESASSMTSATPYPRNGHFFAVPPSGYAETAALVSL